MAGGAVYLRRQGYVKLAAGKSDLDAIIVGAGFAGLYLLHRLRALGLATKIVESADDVGGTWYFNRYPGARCDIESIDYSYSFDQELEKDWQWSERYATQAEILRYLGHVADKHNLRGHILFSTRVKSAEWRERTSTWEIRTDRDTELNSRFLIMASGCLSLPKTPDLEGHERFRGDSYYTGRWPHAEVDFSGQRVAVLGTGSSGVQAIPIIAKQAAQLTVFQRTANFSRPAFNGPVAARKKAAYETDRAAYREAAKNSSIGVPMQRPQLGAFQVSPEQRLATYEAAYQTGELLAMSNTFADLIVNPAANETVCDFLRAKIRAIVRDPATAEALCPRDHFYGTKRPCIDSNYYETYNLPHVRLIDLRQEPFKAITEKGIDTASGSYEFDAIVYATGFDAMTGAIVAVDIKGRDGAALKEAWAGGPLTYLGLGTVGFPNLFLITGPGSPSVLSNMAVSIEQHVDWVSACIAFMRAAGLDTVEPTPRAQGAWVQHVNDYADMTLLPRASSWYMGANVPGKPRVFLPYIGGVDRYRQACDEVVRRDYLGFKFQGAQGTRCNDGIIRPLQPDVALLLEALSQMGLPPLETLSADAARALVDQMNTSRPPGPEVGEIVDGMLAGAEGPLPYRLYRPATAGPHALVAYFHGGGWVLGSEHSDDPFCRDLCLRSQAIVISVGYRHAPEHRFPAPLLDGFAALKWIAANATALGAFAGRLAICGWSAGGNIAAVVCHMARDAGGPLIAGQVLINPVTDSTLSDKSFVENADGYVLTAALMRWFWSHYADPTERKDAMAAPLRAKDLANLPPALVVTCEYDPLREQGAAYSAALLAAGVDSTYLPCRGQIHTSLMAVDVIISATAARAEIGAALRRFLRTPPGNAEKSHP